MPGDVLVVEDDRDLLEVTELILRDAGYEVRGVSNGALALEAAAQRLPQLVLLDMLMPVMDGWMCARLLRQHYGHAVMIVVMTAADHAGKRALEVDADGLLPKPFGLDQLLATVQHYVRMSSQDAAAP